VTLADRIREMPIIEYPWPHAVLDGFFPPDVFAEAVAVGKPNQRTRDLPKSITDVCCEPALLQAIADRHGFPFSDNVVLEVAYTGPSGLKPHYDRADKHWSGQVYLAGDPKGTELFDAAENMVHVIDWQPNRLSCWTPPPGKEKHAGPRSEGRYLLLFWVMHTSYKP
jgi:hypothetical protein